MDVLTKAQRSYCMSQVKGKDTSIEVEVRSRLHRRGYRFRKNFKGLPGRPDIVLSKFRLVVFIDGDFWHGYRFGRWRNKLTPFWRKKILENIKRDNRNFRLLRKSGWRVIRVWEWQIKKDCDSVIERITLAASGRPK